MNERMIALDDAALEAALRDLGGQLAIPPIGAGDLAERARLRIVAGSAAAAPRRPWWWPAPIPGRRVGRGVALALVAAIAIAAVAGAIGLGLPGIRIVLPATPSGSGATSPSASPTVSAAAPATGSSLPTARPTRSVSPAPTPPSAVADPLGANLGLGLPIAIAEASAAVDVPVVLPQALGVGAPATAWLLDGRLTLIWRATASLPATLEPGVGLLVSEFRGSIVPGYFQKVLDQGTTITPVSVGGSPGYWISGAPHEIVYVNPSGDPVFDNRRSVGDTLLWARDDVTYRIESALGRDATVALAESLR